MNDKYQAPSVNPAQVRGNIQFHETLNPKLWENGSLRLEVRVRLLRAALAFYQFLDLPGLRLSDIVITGSNASFNYTELSDVDVHLIVDFTRTTCPDLAENFFSTKKTLWNVSHEITIRGHGLEMYVEDQRQPAYSNGVYSLLRGEWINMPSPKVPAWDDMSVIRKTEQFADEIDTLLATQHPDPVAIQNLLDRLRQMRKSGLAQGGEFSVENLTFKSLRALGYIDLMREVQTSASDSDLSL